MKYPVRGIERLCCALLALLLVAVHASAAVVIENVRIVDVIAGTVGEPADVVIEADRIAAIHSAGETRSLSARRVDGSGRFLVPGFWDMHVHINEPELAAQWMLPLLLASGVTGVRDMAGDCWTPGCADSIRFTRKLQAQVQRGELIGPRILAIASAAIDGPRVADSAAPRWASPADAQQARRLVRELQRRGVDSIKTYDTMPRDAYFALLREARARGIPVSGHVPMSVSMLEAVRAGQRTVEHARFPALDCSRFSRTLHEVFTAWADGDSERIYRGWADDAQPANNLGGYYQPILALYDASLCRQVITQFAASGAYYVPTLITRRFEALADESQFANDPRLPSVPAELHEAWEEDAANLRKRFASAQEKRAYVEFYALATRLVGDAHRAGVPILVGTDTPDSYCFPGSSYHDELMELRKAGLSNADILRSATITAARFMGLEHRFGSVAAGKAADLLLLDGNPLDDIANARRIAALVSNGRLFERRQLDLLQEQAAAFARALEVRR